MGRSVIRMGKFLRRSRSFVPSINRRQLSEELNHVQLHHQPQHNPNINNSGRNNVNTNPVRRQRTTSEPPIRSVSRTQTENEADNERLQLTRELTYPLFVNPHPNNEPTITVNTDASCYHLSPKQSGVGIYFGENHELNSSRELPPPHNSGLAEIRAVIIALRKLKNWENYNSENVLVRSDYLGLIDRLQFPSLFTTFKDEIDELISLAESFPNGVQFEHVKGHNGDFGNEKADELARMATPRGRSRSRSRTRSRSRSRNRSRSRSKTNKAENKLESSKQKPEKKPLPRKVFIAPKNSDV